ncbi:MAG: transketolase C-terminal domain-containing protein, partial [Candidatus Bathyarchaeia archaeon]
METKVISGNEAIAHGVRLSKVQVIPIYPITPQTTIAEYLAHFIANGELKAELIHVEGEHSAMSACYGAELVGARTFTATCSHGLAYMHEPMAQVTAYRLPIVMAVTNRRLGSLHSNLPDYSDTMPERDSGWIQFYLESNQEALDTVIQAYRIAEDPRVKLPFMICIDGFYLSYSNEPVEIPDQEDVDEFLPPYKADHIIMDPTVRFETPLLSIPSDLMLTYERLYCNAMERAKEVIVQVNEEFKRRFGRSYGGLLEQYECEDAEVVLITMGSMTTSARRAVDKLRKENVKIGLIRIRSFRPFPTEEMKKIVNNVDSIGVVDRAVARGVGGGGGPLFADVKAAIYDMDKKPTILNFIAGISGKDVTVKDFEYMARKVLNAAKGGGAEMTVEFIEDTNLVKKYCPP